MILAIPSEDQPAIARPDSTELGALLQGVGVARLREVGWLRVTGADRVRWLNGMVTNSIHELSAGDGCYSFVLNAQGRIQGDLTAFLTEDCILLETSVGQVAGLAALLERFIIMDDVELSDWSVGRAGISVVGPEAELMLRTAGFAQPLDSMQSAAQIGADTLRWRDFDWKPRLDSWRVELIRGYSPLVPRFELWSADGIIDEIQESLRQAGATAISHDALEQLRLLEGTPRFGADIRDRDLPQETSQTRALHFNKGCYLGQEIVERIRSRGQVHRTFGGFELTGTLPMPGTALDIDGKAIGELTSVGAIDHPICGSIQLALGYIRRESLERESAVSYPGGTGTRTPLPYTLSFRDHPVPAR